MTLRSFATLAVALPVLLAAGVAGAAEDKWEITTKMEMVGMPFAMPANTQQVCVPQGQPNNEKFVPAKENCKVSDFKVNGNTSSFHVECPAPDKMSGDGSITRQGGDAYNGTMTMKGVTHGEKVDMKMTYAGRKLGTCDAKKDQAISPAGIMQQQQAMMGQACGQIAEGMSWQVEPQMALSCPTLKKDICARAKKLFETPKTSEAVLDMQDNRKDWKELAGYCAMPLPPLSAKWCALAKGEKNWNNAALICGEDADLEALAKKECTGKMYTAGLVADEYQSLCARYSDRIDPGTAPVAEKKPETKTGKAIDTGKRAVEGMKKLKGLFGN